MDESHLYLKPTSPFSFEIMFGKFSWCLQNIFRFVYKGKNQVKSVKKITLFSLTQFPKGGLLSLFWCHLSAG